MRKCFFIFLLLLSSPSFAQDPVAVVPEKPAPVPVLAGRFGFGIESINQIGTVPVLRYWLNEQTALEAMGGWGSCHWGGAIGLKQNVSRPMNYLCLQLLERFTYIYDYCSPYSPPPEWIYLTVGCGFEAFLPFCENLSVEGWVGVEMVRYWDQIGGWTGYQTASSDLNPMNLGFHFVF